MADDRLQGAIRLVQSGKTADARLALEQIIRTDPCNVPAWFWYAGTWTSSGQRIHILEACLHANPDNVQVQQALAALTSPSRNPIPNQNGIADKPTTDEPSSMDDRLAQPSVNDGNKKNGRVPQTGKEQTSSQLEPVSQIKPKGNRSPSWIMVTAAMVLLAFCVAAGIITYNSIPADPAKHRHETPIEYYLYVPRNYSSDREWPLFVGIHGSGGSGLECWNLWQSFADREGFILLCPSIADSGGGWYQADGETKVFSAINQVRSEYHMAPREFLAGFSAGAQFVQGFAFKYPQYVSGVSVLSAGNYYRPTPSAKGIPFLVVIGDQDDPVAVADSKSLVLMLKQDGFDVQYLVLPGVGHTVTDTGRQLTIALFRKAIGK
jgi:predicted esterase